MMKFLVKNQRLEAIEREVIASDQIAFVSVKFVFDGAWKVLHKVVQFTQCEETYNLVLGTEGNNLLAACRTASRCGENEFVWLRCRKRYYTACDNRTSNSSHSTIWLVADGDTPIPPTPDLYTQLLKKLSEMQTGANGKDGSSAYEIAIETVLWEQLQNGWRV